MKKIIATVLAFLMCFALIACGTTNSTVSTTDTATATEVSSTDAAATETVTDTNDIKIGIVLIGDENEGYTYAHIEGVKQAMEATGLTEDNIIWYYSIPEDETCYDKIKDAASQGAVAVFTNSYGHQTYAQLAASELPNVQVVSCTGDTARKSGLENFSNAFNYTFESRYVSGVVAGMKLAELEAAGQLSAENYDENGNIKVGYVGAYPYAEVVSGYTAFYLGIKSIISNVVMSVQYTNSWFDQTAEAETAQALLASGCVIIGQHADSTGAPSAIQAAKDAGKVCYSIGYNVDMLSVAPTAALTSSTNNWGVYYTYAFEKILAGEKIDTDWAAGYNVGAVAITALGPECAAGTAEKVAEVEAAIKDGTLHVFDTSTFTVGGEPVTTALTFDTDGDYVNDTNEGIVDGYYHESEYISAPSFSLRIDGITELN